ncbi:MAG: ABC transporter permease [Flavobacteriia bacterium]|nr:ABC transporter permease [Flavobacteriia bacterium]
MSVSLLFSISKKLLLARWKQTLIAAIGVTFSITMFVTLLGFMNGLNSLLDGLILNRTPHIKLYNDIKSSEKQAIYFSDKYKNNTQFIHSIKPTNAKKELKDYFAIIDYLKTDKRVLGYTPKVNTQVFFNVGTIDLVGVINGIEPESENKLFKFQEYLVKGNYLDLKNVPNSIVLGKVLADKMMVNQGDLVQITTSQGERVLLKVVGFFQTGLADIDKTQCYASVITTQKIMGKGSSFITDLFIRLNNIEDAPSMAKEFALKFNCDAEDIQTANAQFETGSDIRNLISYAVGITLLIVAGFGIYNILNMMIYEKMDSIAILKASGFSGNDVKKIFISIALTIGIFGGFFGLLFGFSLSAIIDNIPFNTAALPTVTTFPVDYNPKYYIIASLFSVFTTYFAGYFPAKKAGKIDPVVIIRGK